VANSFNHSDVLLLKTTQDEEQDTGPLLSQLGFAPSGLLKLILQDDLSNAPTEGGVWNPVG
jgi:hypothetical protein